MSEKSFIKPRFNSRSGANDRQTKVAACELLHSIVLFMVGTNAKLKPLPIYKLYEHVLPAILRLATDVELIARQLFEPMMLQLIHWFTRNQSYENVETMVLLDVIVEAVGMLREGRGRERFGEEGAV
jgi:DNA-dependent protein kinase catalytic subunit